IHLLREVAFLRGARRDPLELRARVVDPAAPRVVPAQEPGQQEPQAAAVELVAETAVDAVADHELGLDGAYGRLHQRIARLDQPERGRNHDEARIESALAQPRCKPSIYDAVPEHRGTDRLRRLVQQGALDHTG